MIYIEQLSYSVGAFALSDVSLHVRPAEYFVLLGPTGAGKTLLVECLCGLNRIDSGSILIGGADVTRLEPRRRNIGYLPQDYALFPHRTVRRNIGFGLSRRGLSRADIGQQVDALMQQLGIAHLADRLPARLSGGEKQRVALARALAIRPRVLVLDEPVSAVDEAMRDDLCRQLKGVQQATQTAVVHICHNFAEMLTVADRVGIMYQGSILQVGTPQEVLQRPETALVARFVQAGNLFPSRVEAAGEWIELVVRQTGESPGFRAAKMGLSPYEVHRQDAGATTDAGATIRLRAQWPGGELPAEGLAMVRPENIRLLDEPPEQATAEANVLEGTIREVVDLGPTVKLTVDSAAGVAWVVSLSKMEYTRRRVARGDRVHLAIAPQDVHLVRHT